MLPARGQIVLVQNTAPSMLMLSETDDGEHEGMYVMTRAAGGGTILGGSYELGNFDSNPDPNVAARIMQRVVEACPELADNKGVKGLSVVRHAVGFWPHRVCGARVEKEQLNSGTWIIHNYGHDSWGYIASYGCVPKTWSSCQRKSPAVGSAAREGEDTTALGPSQDFECTSWQPRA